MDTKPRLNIVVSHGFEANYTLGFVKGLRANGLSLVVISCDVTQPRLDAAGIPNLNLRGSGESQRCAVAKLFNLARYYARLIWFLLTHRGYTVHFIGTFRNELIVMEGIVLNLAFRLLSGRYIYTVHNTLPHSRRHSRLFRRIYRWVYKIPHLLLVHTHRGKRQLIEEFGVTESRIVVVSIGLNDEVPQTGLSRQAARQRLGFATEEKIVLCFGKIDDYKGVDLAIEAFEQMPVAKARLLIAGAFRSPAYRELIYGLLAKSRRGADITVKEADIPNDEVEILFKAADVLCLAYRNIYQSGVLFLGLRFGVPIVATDVGDFREFVGPDNGLIIPRAEAGEIAAGLAGILARDSEFDRQAIASKALKYRWEVVCQQLAPLYRC